VFYNYLTVVYARRGMTDEAEQTTDDVLQRFPDYLFARLNRAEQLLDEGDTEGVLALLGPRLELRELYPGRRRSHVSEFTGYYAVVGRYELVHGSLARAEAVLDLLSDVAPDAPATIQLAEWLAIPRLADRLVNAARLLKR
jgi:tetratricopeptide (TPR) repeat protein